MVTNDPQQGEDPIQAELKKLAAKLKSCGMPEENMQIAEQELRRLSMTPPNGAEFQVMFNYLETLASLPWNKSTEDSLDVEKAREILDRDHFGIKKAKERILEFLAVKKLMPENKGSILCFVGSPGTGKTSVMRCIAEAMGREFIRTSLGGVHDEAEIRGHRRTYVGAMPGRIIQLIKKVGVNNPVFGLDELDKLGRDFRGDPGAALLEVLDPEQNNSFNDNYLGMPFDLSNVFFIATINTKNNIHPALLDRMEIIEFPGYSPHDKLQIAKRHLIPKQKEKMGLKDYDITFSKNAINRVIEEYTSEAGVRSLERECGSIFRKLAVKVASEKKPPSIVKSDMVPRYLGPSKIFAQQAVEEPSVGVATGLAWSANGGSLLFVESSLVRGKGKVVLTGNLGKVLKESASAAYTWIKANADEFGIEQEKFDDYNVHIHFPAGATPKDGPSAGIAIASSILSTLTGRPIRNDIGMTGEISLRGRVLPIGGLMEKTLAAHRADLTEVVFPVKNECDVEEIPNDVKNEIKLTPVSDLKEALKIIMLSAGDSVDKKPTGKVNSNNEESLINSAN
jgi:ATP-dependent Lon protease